MTDEEKQEYRSLMVEVMGDAIAALENRLDLRFLELESELALINDRLDGIEVDFKDARTHSVRVSREQMREKLRRERFEKRLERLEAIERGKAP